MEFRKGNSIYGKTMEFEQNGRTYGKTMEFSFWWKKVRAFFKKWGKNTSGLRNLVLMFVASVIISLGLALRTSRAIPLAYTVPVVFCAACGRNAAAKFALSRNAFRKIWQFLIRNFKSGFESKIILY